MIYLDAAATTAVRREVLEAMWPYLTGDFGNPSSHHELGETASAGVMDARATVADLFGARPSEVVFTSGGTESDNLAITGLALGNPRGRHLVISAVEHEAVQESCAYLERFHGFDTTVVGVDEFGVVDPAAVAAVLRPDTTLVSVMLANNEVGAVQPVREIAALTHGVGAVMHTDAVQGAGWIDLRELDADAISISGHKLGAPKGIGALYVRRRLPLEPLIHGGGQERGRRSGTENVPGIVALAAAIRLSEGSRAAGAARVSALRDDFITEVLDTVVGAQLTGPRQGRLASNASFCFPGTSGESILLELGRRGVICSAGSACAVGSDEPSHVLLAMGIQPEVAQTAVRFSLDSTVTAEQLREAAGHLAEASLAVRTLGSSLFG
ncbi:cysteine desulfurase [Salinibacterium sp. CAN_S4]|uniref:cysteine desulfurase family protein n=1 Tax=Salinibacterium sp. CAN_S4 TaxID=2787727 RepID=UPI0018F02042